MARSKSSVQKSSDRKAQDRSRMQRRLSFESLENRRVLAGNVFVSLSGAHLLIQGDGAANSIKVSGIPGIPGRVSIEPDFDANGLTKTTKINGKSDPVLLNFPSFGDTRFALAGGDDILNFVGDSGAGDSSTGSLVIDGGSGNNTITVSDYDIAANLTITNGSGSDSVTLTNTHVGNDITINNGASGAATQSTKLLEGTSAGRDLRISNLKGSNSIDISGETGVTVGRDLSISSLGSGATDSAIISLDNVTVASNLNLLSLSVATITLGGGNGATTVAHSTSIRSGAGDNSVTLQDNSSFGTAADTGDKLTIVNGAGNNTVNFNGVTINANTDIRNGAGDASITFQNATAIDGSVFISTANSAAATHTILLQDGSISGSLTIMNGSAADNSIVIGSVASVSVGGFSYLVNGNATTNSISIVNADLTGVVTLSNGSGNDTVTLGNATTGKVTTGSRVAIYNGSGGTTTVNIDGTTTAGAVSIRNLGKGTETVAIGANTPVATGSLSVSVLGGTATITLDQVDITGNAYVQTGAGDDTVNIGGDGAAGLNVSGTTTVLTGAGADTLAFGNGTGTVSLLGFILVQMGIGVDDCTIGTNLANDPITAIASGLFLFDGGVDPIGDNTIHVSVSVIDPLADILTFNKFRNFVIDTTP